MKSVQILSINHEKRLFAIDREVFSSLLLFPKMMLSWIFLITYFALIKGFGNLRFHHDIKHSTYHRLSQQKLLIVSSSSSSSSSSQQEGDSPNIRMKRIVESLSRGEKTSVEVEQELRALEIESKLLDVCTGASGSIVGLVAGALLNGVLAHGNAPWAGPLGYACLGGASYYGSIQKERSDISEVLISILGQPTLNTCRGVLESIEFKIENTKAAAMKRIDSTVEDINQIPITIQNSIVDAKDSTVSRAKAIPIDFQRAVVNSYNIMKQNAIAKADQKVAEVSESMRYLCLINLYLTTYELP
jgi:tetrahydromethanopterin S-methyltransferase subunit F